MPLTKKDSSGPWLYDSATGRTCAIKQPDGLEDYLVMMNPTTGTPVDGVKATLTTDMANANADVTLTAVEYGNGGNLISVTYIDPSALSQSLTVLVDGTAIKVYLATDGDGTVTSTAAQVVAAVNAHSLAGALVLATYEGTGAGVVEAKTVANLAGGVTGTVGVAGSSFIVNSAGILYRKTGAQTWAPVGSQSVLAFKSHSTSEAIAAIDMYGTRHLVSAAATLTCADFVAGMHFSVLATAAEIISVKAGASSKLVVDLTALDNGDKVSSAGDKYSEIEVICHTDGEAVVHSLGGTWADGGA